MARFLILLLVLNVIAGDVARGFDMHTNAGCADSERVELGSWQPPEAPGAPDTGTDRNRDHGGDCCFGSLLMGSPAASAGSTLMEGSTSPLFLTSSQRASWHSDGPERPPRP